MEEDSEGHSDSDISAGWSFVDHNLEIVSAFKSSTDSGLAVERSGSSYDSSNENIDECFELTEMSLSSADPLGALSPSVKVVPELSRSFPSVKKYLDNNESDGDTDGISVISEDEEYLNWQQAAHDNYKKTMRLIHSPTPTHISSEESPLDYDDPCDETITEDIKEPEIMIDTTTETALPPSYDHHDTADANHDNDDGNNDMANDYHDDEGGNNHMADDNINDTVGDYDNSADVVVFDEGSYQQIITSSVSKNFITYAVIVAMACMAIAHFIRTGHGKEEVLEMLDELRSENEALKFKVQDLSNAYATLEAKVLSSELPIISQPTKTNQDTTGKLTTVRAKDLLTKFISLNPDKDLEFIAMKLLKHFENIENNKIAGDFSIIEQKIVDCVSKFMKRGKNDSKNKYFRLSELEKRINHKLKHLKENHESLNIIQWYPDEPNSLESMPNTEKPVNKNLESKNERLQAIVEPISESKTFSEKPEVSENSINEKVIEKPVTFSENLENERLKIINQSITDSRTFSEKLTKPKVTENSKNEQVIENPITEPVKVIPKKIKKQNLAENPKNKRLKQTDKPIKRIPENLSKQTVTENMAPKNEKIITEPIKNFPEKSTKQKFLKKDKYSIKNGNKFLKEKIPKIKILNGKDGQNCDGGKNKTGTWFINRAKSREELRKIESLSDWQFSRGRRDLKRDDAFWYFKKFKLNSRNF